MVPGLRRDEVLALTDLRAGPDAEVLPSGGGWSPSHEPPADILVVGAGPTGLALALQAHDHGARVRVVERRPEAFRPSRAMIVHPRTLEVLRPLGVTDALLARADTSPTGVPAPGALRAWRSGSATWP